MVEILVTGHSGSDVARGNGVFVGHLARLCPAHEFVRLGNGLDILRKASGSAEHRALAAGHIEIPVLSCNCALARIHVDVSCPAIRVGGYYVIARLHDRKRQVWRINLIRLVGIEAVDINLQSALGQLNLCGLVVEIQKGDPGRVPHAQSGAADKHLGPRILVGPEVVARRQRPIQFGIDPILFSRRLI